MTRPINVAKIVNLPAINGDFTVIELAATSGSGDDILANISAEIALEFGSGDPRLSMQPTGLLISNDHASATVYVNSVTAASGAARGVAISPGNALYLAIIAQPNPANAVTYSTTGTASVAVFY